jgi:hypothetical protein
MHVGRAETARPPDDDAAILFMPFQHGARADAELLPHFCWD